MYITQSIIIIFWYSGIPCNAIYKIGNAKYLIADFCKIFDFTIINTNKDNAIICKHISCQ